MKGDRDEHVSGQPARSHTADISARATALPSLLLRAGRLRMGRPRGRGGHGADAGGGEGQMGAGHAQADQSRWCRCWRRRGVRALLRLALCGGLCGLIFVHESGHALVLKHYGVYFWPIVFVPLMGAAIEDEGRGDRKWSGSRRSGRGAEGWEGRRRRPMRWAAGLGDMVVAAP